MEQKFNDELMTTVGYFSPCMEDEEMDSEVVTVNEAFRPKCVIEPVLMPIPKEGHIGYVKFENPQEYAELCEPQWGDVDDFKDMSDEELADLGKLRDDAGRIHDALYLDDAGRPARDAKGRLLDAMPSIGGYAYRMEEPAEDYQVETVNVGFEPKRVINI